MKIELKEITIRELYAGYENNKDNGVVGFGGNLDIRPIYQREFVYPDHHRNAVINTVRRNFPLNVMYWVNKGDGTFEVLDGQQRTMSICEYVAGNFSINFDGNRQQFNALETVEQDQIYDYKLMVYFCEGNSKEKLDWFKTINIAGMELTEQELRNAVYSGEWLSAAKKDFSKSGCAAGKIGRPYLTGAVNRQAFLQTALKWISKGDIETYMSKHRCDQNAEELWGYFKNVIEWVKSTFPHCRKEMKGLDFGTLYDKFKNADLDAKALEAEISKLMQDESVTKKSGIYAYVLTGDKNLLNLRAFNPNQKREAYERQGGKCVTCGDHFEVEEMEGDHIIPWSKGGQTVPDNCQMLCKYDNNTKSNK